MQKVYTMNQILVYFAIAFYFFFFLFSYFSLSIYKSDSFNVPNINLYIKCICSYSQTFIIIEKAFTI